MDTWYTFYFTKIDTIQRTEKHIGSLEGSTPISDISAPFKNRCEIKFQMDRISIKKGEARIKEFLVDGATVWNNQKISSK